MSDESQSNTQVSDLPPEPPKEEWEIQRDTLKSQADDAFRASNYSVAIGHYTSAIALDPSNAILFSNRSAAYLSNNEKSKALHDAQECIKIDGKFVKGYNRLGAALLSLKRGKDALELGYSVVLKMDKGNKVAIQGAELVRKMEAEKKKREIEREKELARMASEAQKKMQEGIDKTDKPQDVATASPENTVKEVKTQDDDGKDDGDGEDDLLDDFFSEVESATNKKKPVDDPPPHADKKESSVSSSRNSDGPSRIKLSNADLGTPVSQMDRLLGTNYEWKNLNPYAVLAIPHDVDHDMVSRRYKALSLLIHPDKCRDDDRARDAFEEVRKAMKTLEDETKRKHVQSLVEQGRKQGKRDWLEYQKQTSVENQGVGEVTLETMQEKAVMKLFAKVENSRRDIERRKRNQEKRERSQEDEEANKVKSERDFEKKWREENRVEKRIGNWRSFNQSDAKKKKKSQH
mmetsp:Transcript_26796/g.39649  ORF Transcript_26796/g.39649 Transcript_26796/m.39649 type:complete len:461 (-) Transcript_26796:19-1401(-)